MLVVKLDQAKDMKQYGYHYLLHERYNCIKESKTVMPSIDSVIINVFQLYATKNVNNSVTNISTLCDSSRAPSFPFDPLPFDPLPVLELPLPLDPLELLAHPPIFTHFGTVLPSLYDVSASRKKDDDDDASSMVRKYSLYHIAIYAIILPRG